MGQPKFTYIEIPEEFQKTQKEIARLYKTNEPEFKKFVLRVRDFLKSAWEEKHHPLMFGNKKDEDIRADIKSFNAVNNRRVERIEQKIDNKKCLVSNTMTSIINFWFPEIAEVRIVTGKSKPQNILERVFDDNLLYKNMYGTVVKNCLKMYTPTKTLFPTYFGTPLKLGRGNQVAGNFPPVVARWIYTYGLKQFPNETEYIMYDPCMGWGGRMIGFLSAVHNNDIRIPTVLLGTDVNSATHDAFYSLYEYWYDNIVVSSQYRERLFGSAGAVNKVKLEKFMTPAEDVHLNADMMKYAGRVNFAFTSPPYFSKEWYSNDENQSASRYTTYEGWRDGFLRGMIQNTYALLKKNGIFMLNIANTRYGKDVMPNQDNTKKIAEETGFELVDMYYLGLPLQINVNIQRKESILTEENDDQVVSCFIEEDENAEKSVSTMKVEPIFVFKKK